MKYFVYFVTSLEIYVVILSLIWKGCLSTSCYCNNKDSTGHEMRTCINNRCKTPSIIAICYISKPEPNLIEKGCTFRSMLHWYRIKEKEHKKTYFIWCNDGDLCNENVTTTNLSYLSYDQLNSITQKTILSKQTKVSTVASKLFVKKKEDSGFSNSIIAATVAVPILFCIILATILVLYKQYRKRTQTGNLLIPQRTVDMNEFDLSEFTGSGSGAGLPLLVQQTIAQEILLLECIGNGSFGDVHRGVWHGQDVAVKIFSTSEESSWSREVQIYQTTMLRHENVLGFIASVSKDTGSCTQLWMIFDYHSKGSVYDLLQTETVNQTQMLQMIFSAINGLSHLHMEIMGTQGKPAMAHRDIKTKNILIKNNYTCCIADLGLAVLHTSISNKIDVPTSSRTGTRRYQSPELLDDKINFQHFDSFRRADVYAMGLCIWEMCRRTVVDGRAEDYQLPYFSYVELNPSDDDIRQIVCVDGKRPKFPSHWHTSDVMTILMKLMTECWYRDAAARLTTLRLKKDILALCNKVQIEI